MTIRKKRQHKFQLDINKDVEAWLHERIPILTKQRKFSQYVRDGLSLMIYFAEWGMTAQAVYDLFCELREGKKGKLYEMFPHLKEEHEQAAPPPAPPPPPDTSALERKIEQLTQLVLERGGESIPNTTNIYPQMSGLGGLQKMQPAAPKLATGKALNAPQFALPVFDDDDEQLPTLVTTKGSAPDAGINFLGGIMSLR